MSIAEKLTAIAENEQRVYDAGKKAEYDAFWDVFQDNGNRTNYQFAFAGFGWTPESLNPKYKIAPVDTSDNSQLGANMFYRCNGANAYNGKRLDFSKIQHLFDFSNLIRPNTLFDSCALTNVFCDLSSAKFLNYTFSSQWGAGVDKLTLKVSDKVTDWTNAFLYNNVLTELFFTDDSTIVASVDLKTAPLTKASITSVINTLSSTASGKTLTLKKSAKEAAFTADEWAALIATKTNWTISLV